MRQLLPWVQVVGVLVVLLAAMVIGVVVVVAELALINNKIRQCNKKFSKLREEIIDCKRKKEEERKQAVAKCPSINLKFLKGSMPLLLDSGHMVTLVHQDYFDR